MAKRKAKRKVGKKHAKSPLRLPEEVISPAFRKFTKPVSKRQKRRVYAFVEVASSYAGLGIRTKTIVIPVVIGRLTRGQLEELSGDDIDERIRLAIPGTSVIELHGFGHELTRLERKGKRFTGAAKPYRKARRQGNRKRNRSADKTTKKRGSDRRIRHRVRRKA